MYGACRGRCSRISTSWASTTSRSTRQAGRSNRPACWVPCASSRSRPKTDEDPRDIPHRRESGSEKLADRWFERAELGRRLDPRSSMAPVSHDPGSCRVAGGSQEIRAGFIREAQQYLGTTWERIPATVTLQYIRSGNRSNYDALNTRQREKLATLVFAEVFENQGRFLDEIADGIWAICEQTYWGSTAHLGMQRAGTGLPDVTEPIVDLFAAETGALLAWTDYLLGDRLDKVSPLLRKRIRAEVDRRVLTPALQRDDFWWMGFGERKNINNWNPWINSNWLAAVLLLEADPPRRTGSVYKIMRSLDNFINIYPDDGASDEGPGYWGRAGASLFDNLELLRSATNGTIDIYRAPLVRSMGQYIYRVYINDQYFIPMGDASAKLTPDAELVYQYGKRIGDPVMQGFGALLAQRRGPYRPGSSSPGRILPALFVAREIATAQAAEPLLGSVWLADLQLMAARSTPT